MNLAKFVLLILSFFQVIYAEDLPYSKEFISQSALDLATDNQEFCFQLYRNLSDIEGNFCFSPYSISSALAMVYNGAKEETKKEMREVLRFNQPLETLNESFSALNRFFMKISTDITTDFKVDITNSLWMQTGITVLPTFLDDMGKYFKASLRRVDFLRQRETARRDINSFVKEKTFGKVTDLVGPDDITDFTKMLLVSSIYMKAKWQQKFDNTLTKMEPFFVNLGKTKSVSMMSNTAIFQVFKSDHFIALDLSYVRLKEFGPDLRFLILLPKTTFGLSDLEKEMNKELFQKILNDLESEEITLFMPKFKFTKGFSLKDILTKMGMGLSFGAEADFSGITGSKDLQIGQVSHKVYIAVNEEGTEAAAATSVSMNLKSVFNKDQPFVVKVDHPFMFVIYEKLTGSILFCGRVVIPNF